MSREPVTPSGRYSVVYLSSIDWDFRRQDHQFVCLELAARGHPVLFVENTGARWPGLRDLDRVVARVRHWLRGVAAPRHATPELIEIASPLVLPGGAMRAERALNRALARAQLGGGVSRLGGSPRVLWVGLPTWLALDLADWLAPDLLVYYCGDAFSEIPGVRRALVESEHELLRRADVVFANSQALADHCAAAGARPIRVPIGIDLAASGDARTGRTPIPRELRGLRGRLIGYMGGLNHKVDVGLLDAVSEAFPEDTLVILGSVEDSRFSPRPAPNVVILGERPYEAIGAYLARFDVCLIPYVLNEFTAGVYPGKLVEYLALGRPVVSTPLPEVLPYARLVRVASTRATFLQAVRESLQEEDDPEQRARRVRAVERNSYERVVAEMVSAVDRALGEGAADRDRG